MARFRISRPAPGAAGARVFPGPRCPARLASLLSLALLAGPVAGARTFTGQTASGAFYTIEAPEDWTPADGLVIYNHGFDIGSVESEPDVGALSAVVGEQGFAVAASSYSLNGWALFNTLQDNRELYQAFVDLLGEPERVIVFGGSLGALVTLQAVEAGGIGNVVGAYPVCGPLAGSVVWDQGLDLRLIYDVVCDGVSGAQIPGGETGLPFALDPDQLDGIVGEATAVAIGAAVNACTGFLQPPLLRSEGQQRRLERLLSLVGMDEDFLPINLGYATVGLSDLVFDPAKLDQRRALGNAFVDYGDPEVNARIARVEADPFDALFLKRAYTPTGRVGATKVLATHTDKDDLIVVEHLRAFGERAPQAQVAQAVVIDDSPGHCQYSPAELVGGWEALLDWIDTGARPTAGDIQARCEALAAGERQPGPCRYDPAFEIPAVETRIRPRNRPSEPVSGDLSGSFYVREKSGQGWFVEILEGGRAVVYWFTFDPEGRPAWIGGVGEVLDDAIAIDEAWITRGARFGPAFSPEDVQLEAWGELAFVFTGPGAGLVHYAGPEGWGEGRETIEQLTRLGLAQCPGGRLSGLWYDPARNGEGIIVEGQGDGRVFVAWFTYDLEGGQLWLYGEAREAAGTAATVPLAAYQGPRFGAGFDPEDLQAAPWGTLELQLRADDRLAVGVAPTVPGFAGAELVLERLTRPLATGSCMVAAP